MNIKKQYSIRDLGIPSVFSGTNILSLKDNQWYINGQPTGKYTSEIPSELGSNTLHFYERASGETENYVFQKNLELLNQRINAIHKELTYWDLYKLTASVENSEDLDAVFSSLSIGQSLVINCPTFTKGGKTYARGDVLVRTSENEEIKIDALSTGLFYPAAITHGTGNIYTIKYKYGNGEPSGSIELPVGSEYLGSILPDTINFTGLQDETGNIYGQIFNYTSSSSIHFDIITEGSSGTAILPIIKTFTEDYEEIIIDSKDLILASAGSQWTIEMATTASSVSGVLKYIQIK